MLRKLFKRRDKVEAIDAQIDSVLLEMTNVGVLDEKYPKLMVYLDRLNKMKTDNRPSPVSRDTIILVLGNIAGILVIVAYEQKHVMTSKGFNLVNRPLK